MSLKFDLVLLTLFVILIYPLFANAFSVSGGGNITNFSNVTGLAINITGPGYYYFVASSTAATPAAGHINYTEPVGAGISIESPNVTVDCRYPSLPSSRIAGATTDGAGSVNTGIVVNATRLAGDSMRNVTIKNCIFMVFDTGGAAGIRVIGNATDVTIYNVTVNDSTFGILIAANGTSNGGFGRFVNINISTSTFYNITGISSGISGGALIGAFPAVASGSSTNPTSFVDSTIEHNNFTLVTNTSAVFIYNASNLTMFNNSVYNSGRGFELYGINNSNISNNNITNVHRNTLALGIGVFNYSSFTGDISSVPNTIANNWIFNVSVGITGGAGIKSNLSNVNYTSNTVNYTDTGFELGTGGANSVYYNRLTSNIVGNATDGAITLGTAYANTLVNNTIRDSLIGIGLVGGANETSSVGNTLINTVTGFVTDDAFNTTSQDDSIGGNVFNASFFIIKGVNFTATNLSANLSNLSWQLSSEAKNFTVRFPVNVTVTKASDGSVLSGAKVAIKATTNLPTGVGGILNDSAVLNTNGVARYNITVFIARSSGSDLERYNFTPHSITASLSGYIDGSSGGVLPSGAFAKEQNFSISLTAPTRSTDSSSGIASATPPETPEQPEAPQEPSEPTPPEERGVSQTPEEEGVAGGVTESGAASQAQGQLTLQLPLVGTVQIDPLLAIGAGVVIVIILAVILGLV